MNIQVTNMSRKLTEDDLIKLFATYGTVSKATIVMDSETNLSKGFGFVEMDDEDEGNKAIESLHKTKAKGERLRVKQVKDRS